MRAPKSMKKQTHGGLATMTPSRLLLLLMDHSSRARLVKDFTKDFKV